MRILVQAARGVWGAALAGACLHVGACVLEAQTLRVTAFETVTDNRAYATFGGLQGSIGWSNSTPGQYYALQMAADLDGPWFYLWRNGQLRPGAVTHPIFETNADTGLWLDLLDVFEFTNLPQRRCFYRLEASASPMEPIQFTNRVWFVNRSEVPVSNLWAEYGLDWSYQSFSVEELPSDATSRWEFVESAPIPDYEYFFMDQAAGVYGSYEHRGQTYPFSFWLMGLFDPLQTLTIMDGTNSLE